MKTILKAENIYKSYKIENRKIEVLKDVNFEIAEGESVVIIGASGAGKSTLLHVLSGLDYPDAGKVYFYDKEIFSQSDDEISLFRNEQIGFVFQFHYLLPEFTAVENVAMPMLVKNVSYSKAVSRAKELLSEVELSDRANHKPAELSGGEQQRVAIARALANNPKLLFADEPTGNLDTATSETVKNLLVNLKQKHGLTMLLVTHNSEFGKIGDRILRMKDGQLQDG